MKELCLKAREILVEEVCLSHVGCSGGKELTLGADYAGERSMDRLSRYCQFEAYQVSGRAGKLTPVYPDLR